MTASIFLAQEELVYLLQLLQLSTLPGMPPNLLLDVTPEQYAVAMSIAERCLRARGFIQFQQEEPRFLIESAVVGTLNFCKHASQSIAVRRLQPDGTVNASMFHLSGKMKVKHQAIAGVHEFTLLSDANAVLDEIMNLFIADVEMEEIEPAIVAELPAEALLTTSIFRNPNTVSDDEMFKQLIELGLNSEQTIIINRVLRHDLIASATIGSWEAPSESDEGLPALGLIQTQNAWWLLAPNDNKALSESYTLYKMNSIDVREALLRSFSSYMD